MTYQQIFPCFLAAALMMQVLVPIAGQEKPLTKSEFELPETLAWKETEAKWSIAGFGSRNCHNETVLRSNPIDWELSAISLDSLGVIDNRKKPRMITPH